MTKCEEQYNSDIKCDLDAHEDDIHVSSEGFIWGVPDELEEEENNGTLS